MRKPALFTAAVILLGVTLQPAAGHAARKKPNKCEQLYADALKSGTLDARVDELLSRLDAAEAEAEMGGLARVLARHPDDAVRTIDRLLGKASPTSTTAAAELLWHMAQYRRLTAKLADRAAGLLAHDDRFVAALAEWAIATSVGQENNGQKIVWPKPNPPQWFTTWSRLSPDFLLEADYARQAAVWHMHYSGKKLLGSVEAILRRAETVASEAKGSGGNASAVVDRQIQKLKGIRDRLAKQIEARPEDLVAHRKLWLAARRAARPIVMANPAIDFDRVVYIRRHAAHSHRNITGSQYPWVHKPGGDICVQTGLHPGGEVRGVLQGKLGPGHVHGIDLWWDADRVVFGYAQQTNWPPKWDTVRGSHAFDLRGDQEPTHIFQIHLDGTGLRQLTNHRTWNDFEPTYCANGDIVFASDRSARSSQCGNFRADHTVINIYAVSPDGSNLRRLSDNKDIDRYPHSLDDGSIAYTRWEYQERHFMETHAVWTVRPDGTMSDAVCNQHMRFPYGLRDTRSIPNSARLVSIATGHHTFAYGPVVIIDPRRDINDVHTVQVVTPYVRPQEGRVGGKPVPEGGVPDRGGLYQTPWALSETCFLASYSYARPPSHSGGGRNANGFSLYLIDRYGNKELIHRDLLLSCAFPMPLRKRLRPPVVSDMRGTAGGEAVCYVTDTYNGIEAIPRGTIKYIRIMQRTGWPLDSTIGAMRWIPGNAWEKRFGFWSWAPVRVIGTVPVEKDGSAHFRVPADTAVYFQALDENHMEVRRMRSHVTFQPGETRGCRGCHESQGKTPDAVQQTPLALLRNASTPTPPPWGSERLLGYEWLIQPIFDRHCVTCHGGDTPKGGIDLTATRTEDGFYQSFRTLFGHTGKSGRSGPALLSCSNRFSGASVSKPKAFGSHKSRLIQALLKGRGPMKDVKLSRDEWIALVTWVDANAPYYDTFFNRRPKEGGKARREVLVDLPAPFTP